MVIRQLRYFLAVAESRSLLKAADSLYVSRQAISKSITQLEDELNVDLFVRNQDGSMMTPAGIYFYPRAATIVADFDKLEKEMKEFDRTYRPKVNICLALGIYNIYAEKLRMFAEAHKHEMQLQVTGCLDSECESMLINRQADMVLTSVPIQNKIADNTIVLKSPVQLLVNKEHPLASKEKLESSDVDNETFLFYIGGHKRCLWLEREPAGPSIKSNDSSYLFSLLKGNSGIMPIAEAAIPNYLDFAEVKNYPLRTAQWKVFCARLDSSYYDLNMDTILDEIITDVFTEE